MKKLFFILAIMFITPSLLFNKDNNIKGVTVNMAKYQNLVPTSLLPENYVNIDKGITENYFYKGIKLEAVGNAEEYTPNENLSFEKKGEKIQADTAWQFADSVSINSLLSANSNWGIKINIPRRRLVVISPMNLSDEAKAAILKSPKWIRTKLENTFSKLEIDKQKLYATAINQAKDPYIDEIAYAIAYTAPSYLSSFYCYPQLFIDNATIIYNHDKDLNYVDIVDYGTSATDDNYYSTVKYWKIDTSGNKVQIEEPKEIYYMYLVNPKLSDDMPAYIDPELAEENSNHTTNITNATDGVLWREYLYSYTEERPDTTGVLFPVLKDSIKLCDVVWDERNNSRQAVREITKWIKSVMNFNSDIERPHQPVRIYKLHLGRCGEHEDITNAASRACLIPCRGISAYSSDHVWNEFWDEKWWQWEPVNNSHKDNFVYSKGWGKKFGSVLARQSNGPYLPVTDTYCEKTSTITLTALDKNSKPIDGATVWLAVAGTLDSTSIFMDSYGITDNDGKYTFIVDAGRIYYARLVSSIGNYPTASNQVVQLITNPQPGKNYSYQLKAGGSMPVLSYTDIPMPAVAKHDFLIKVNYSLQQVINWDINFDDFGGNTYFDKGTGTSTLLFADEENFTKCQNGTAFSSYNFTKNVKDTSFTFRLDDGGPYYLFFNSKNKLNNYTLLNASVSLYAAPGINAVDESRSNQNLSLMQNYPNPFERNTNISLEIIKPTFVKLNIYNSLGEIIKNLYSGLLSEGMYSFNWNGTDSKGNILPSGVYFYSLDNETGRITKEMILAE